MPTSNPPAPNPPSPPRPSPPTLSCLPPRGPIVPRRPPPNSTAAAAAVPSCPIPHPRTYADDVRARRNLSPPQRDGSAQMNRDVADLKEAYPGLKTKPGSIAFFRWVPLPPRGHGSGTWGTGSAGGDGGVEAGRRFGFPAAAAAAAAAEQRAGGVVTEPAGEGEGRRDGVEPPARPAPPTPRLGAQTSFSPPSPTEGGEERPPLPGLFHPWPRRGSASSVLSELGIEGVDGGDEERTGGQKDKA
ncbi:hypothetical protein GTA08_BOTSDO14308 [Botryosphaeria dothidea]|uniref:Uncharacterized protein n=1 Tax=Botryosphaeria dothidea TaxID=55169 RepID=A0A8H4IKD6_9PEZI|nr:hypothetical protein GTA08_BOTSDO14308 [Botryosphaeria dothidea]